MIESILHSDFENADAAVYGLPYEHTASFGGGTKNGPALIRNILDEQIELFDRYLKCVPVEKSTFGYRELSEITSMSPDDMVAHVKKVIDTEDRFFVGVGGEHSVSIPLLQSVAEKHDPNDVTVVQIDAHFDLRDDDSEYNETNPSHYAHSTVMRRAHDLGYNLLPIGIRTMYKDEHAFAAEHNIPYFEWGRHDTATPSIETVLSSITTDKVYLTIDVDGFDPAVMPGTGTPVPGGLTWEYGEHLIRSIMLEKSVVAADMVEVSPVEHSSQTEYNAGQLVYHILALSQE